MDPAHKEAHYHGPEVFPINSPPPSLQIPATRASEGHFHISGFYEDLRLTMATIISRSAKHFHYANRSISLHRLRLHYLSPSPSVLAGANLHDRDFPPLHSVGFLIDFD